MSLKNLNLFNTKLVFFVISIVARGKALHSAVSSLQNFDRSLEKFVAWLSEAESLLDAAERDPHLLKVI